MGASRGWSEADQNNLSIAKDLEYKLRDFNIGYDVRSKSWIKNKGGSRYFNGLAFWGFAKNKVGQALESFKKG